MDKPTLYIGKFGREKALNELNANINYFIFYTKECNHFWANWFPFTHYRCLSLCRIKTRMKQHISKNGTTNFILDLGQKKVGTRITNLLSEHSIVISSAIKNNFLKFRCIDDEIINGFFRVPIYCDLHPPNYEEQNISPPKYCEPNIRSGKPLFIHKFGIQENAPPIC